jgi:bifunctional non-homologous end joining protein LigD
VDGTFVIQEHHATALHWDFRLERDGVLVSWAVPKNLPMDPGTNRLAVHVEDHALEHATYTSDRVTIWDSGHYELLEWAERKVKVVLHGSRVQGTYVLFATSKPTARKQNWMVHRMSPPTRPDFEPLPELVRPMLAVPGELPADDDGWVYEMKWDGVRAVAYLDGGRVRLMSRNDLEITASYPEVVGLGEQLGSTPAVLDGELVAFNARGAPDFGRLQQRMHIKGAAARRLVASVPVVYLLFDVLHLDGRDTHDRPWHERRALLEELGLEGASWRTPTAFDGAAGQDVLAASLQNGLEGVLAKRRDAAYRPGRRSSDWRKVKHVRMQEVLVCGWRPGKGRRADGIGALILGVHDDEGRLRPAGAVGTGFSDRVLVDLLARLAPTERATSPFTEDLPTGESRGVHWVAPTLVGEVAFAEWTSDGRLRHATWRGLRPDKQPTDVVREA